MVQRQFRFSSLFHIKHLELPMQAVEELVFKTEQIAKSDPGSKSKRGYIVHYDRAAWTSEGFGSHARGTIFPLVHIAQELGLEPVFAKDNTQHNTARDYSTVDVSSFLSATDVSLSELEDQCRIVCVNTWTDPIVGSACGDAVILADMLKECPCNGSRAGKNEHETLLLVKLDGAFRYMNPTRSVYNWLQNVSSTWLTPQQALRIAAHVRVPEDFCPQFWKNDNSLDKLFSSLELLENALLKKPSIDMFTESSFSTEAEERLRKRFPLARVHRGTSDTLTHDLKQLAQADIFIPSSSHFSALAGYLCRGIILLTDLSRMDYFQSHIDLGCCVIDISSPDFESELQNLTTHPNPNAGIKENQGCSTQAAFPWASHVDERHAIV